MSIASSFILDSKQARGRGLVLLDHAYYCKGGASRFDQTTGIMNDVFLSENSDDYSESWCTTLIPNRALLIECKAC